MRHPIHQQQWLEYLDGTLPQTVAAQFRRHLDDCPECRRTAEGLCACQHEITREAARLMGLPDSYSLPRTTTGALHVAGDGVAVPVVRWLAQELLEPLLDAPAAIAAE